MNVTILSHSLKLHKVNTDMNIYEEGIDYDEHVKYFMNDCVRLLQVRS